METLARAIFSDVYLHKCLSEVIGNFCGRTAPSIPREKRVWLLDKNLDWPLLNGKLASEAYFLPTLPQIVGEVTTSEFVPKFDAETAHRDAPNFIDKTRLQRLQSQITCITRKNPFGFCRNASQTFAGTCTRPYFTLIYNANHLCTPVMGSCG